MLRSDIEAKYHLALHLVQPCGATHHLSVASAVSNDVFLVVWDIAHAIGMCN